MAQNAGLFVWKVRKKSNNSRDENVMSLGVPKLDHIKRGDIRGSVHIKEDIVDKIECEKNDAI